MLKITKLVSAGAGTGTKPLTPNPRLFPHPHNPSWLLLLLPLCKLLASSKAHCKSFSCENFPDRLSPYPPDMTVPPLSMLSLLCAYIVSISLTALHCNDLFMCLSSQLDSKLFKVKDGSFLSQDVVQTPNNPPGTCEWVREWEG